MKPVPEKALTTLIYICRLKRMKRPRLSRETLLVIEKFAERATEWRYGYELGRDGAEVRAPVAEGLKVQSGTNSSQMIREALCGDASWWSSFLRHWRA